MLHLCQSTNVTMRGSKCHNTFTHMKGHVPLFHICKPQLLAGILNHAVYLIRA
uniref:Uncharacterized protein n=1 Tax=Picea sitchensis TaxID=3332 RepID=D5ABD0_PICSI|nr:unknown [Picea sitchensis]